jgi:hypothetical protein
MRRRALAAALLLALGQMSGAAAQGAPAGLPRLTGIVVMPGRRIALFEGAAVQEGEQVAAYTVRTISADGVWLEGEGRSFALLPTPLGADARAPADTGGGTFGLVVNPPAPTPD